MVSMVEAAEFNNEMAMDSVMPKSEPPLDGSISSAVSTPEPDAEALTRDPTQTQKRKGGRKPIYATSEERKQRNRQAQAAFRERRTEYIRQLETTIKRNEETLQTLQQSHRSAADECLMLRYKNSLLERILMEKGIDVQAELRMKTSASGATPMKQPNPMASKPTSTLERAAVNRSTVQRHPAGIAPKSDQFGMAQHREGAYGMPSPQFQATPPSHMSSPSHTKSPGFAFQGALSPAATDPHVRSQLLPQPRSFGNNHTSPPMGMPQQSDVTEAKSMLPGGTAPLASRVASAYYPSPFQKHYDQLEQEYDAQADMVDEPDHEDSADPSSYVPSFTSGSAQDAHNLPSYTSQSVVGANGVYGNANQHLLGQYEPMLDTDPFGLSASMHFQTPFSYEQNNARH
ncbi:hypothetical protein ASPZODRAFT_148877 [Penicilliopsis zonata CBS 506.65]|uniref:BZIP domain-containing protein n=1 Tax=Penicilliopsis zonata CBS 506.65 TaxID=1073090 RepID=A0A1L9SWU0_9EURO|nr:hypothetical protein ASPZODRAFT_148877 [Penicilliopsis zonata CBS 506.65]OJJ51626.1 hypothetical protein ASPZODRAFT_148877 [Penicilliopsis zonata CBS 506.65]